MSEEARDVFAKGYNCSQSVICALAPHVGLSEEVALKVSAGLGGGCGRQGEICGAITGAVLALGFKYGSTTTDPAAKKETYDRVTQLIEEFKAKHGAIRCRDLIGCELSTPEGLKEASERRVHQEVCPTFVPDAAEIALKHLSR